MPNILWQAWSSGTLVRCVLLSSLDVTDGGVKVMVIASIMEIDITIIIIVTQFHLVGIMSWSVFVGGMNLVDIDVTLLCCSGQELQVSVKGDGLFGSLGNCSSSVFNSG